MAIDPSIPLQVQTPKFDSPMENAARALSLKGAMQESQIRDLQYKSTLKSMDEEEQFKKALADPTAYERDPVTQTVIPKSDTIKQLYSISPAKAQALQKSITENQKAAFAMQKDQLETSSKKLDMVHNVASGALDKFDELVSQGIPSPVAAQQVQPLYQRSVGELRSANLLSPQELQNIPPQFDPERARQGVAQMISAKDKMVMKQKQLEDIETSRFHREEIAQKREQQQQTAGLKRQELGIQAGRLGIEKQKLDMVKSGRLDDETVSQMADQYMAGDKSVMQNLGRGAQGAENIVKLRKEISGKMRDSGMSGKDIASSMAEFEGQKAGQRALGTRSAQVDLAVTEAQKLIPLALDASEKFDRTKYKSLNDIQIAIDSRTASPELRRFNAANNSLVNVYSRAVSPSGAPTVSDKEHAREILETAFSKGDYQAGVDQLQKEMEAAQLSPRQVKKDMRSDFTDKPRETEKSPSSTSKKLVYDPATGKFK